MNAPSALPAGAPLPVRRPPGNPLAEFAAGAGDVWRGLGLLLRHPNWWHLALLPFLINIMIFIALIWFGYAPLNHWAQTNFFNNANAWWSILGGLIVFVFWAVVLIVVFFLFVPFATVIAAPFNDFLSEKVELAYRGASVDKKSFVQDTWRAVWVGLATSVRLSLVTILLYALILPLHFIPGIGSVLYTILAAIITIRFMALQFTAYSMDRRFYDYRQRSSFLKRYRWRTIGLGAMTFLLMWVPGLNLLFAPILIPVSAVAGTLLFCDTELS